MDHAAYREERAEDMRRLRGLLRRALPSPPPTGQTEIAILNIACGACDEAQTICDFFGSLHSSPCGRPGATSLIGTDVRQRELDEARDRFRSVPGRAFQFLAANASTLDKHRELPERFDVVFLRHQNLYNGRLLWRRIFDQGLGRLGNDGVLVMTSYFDREHALALRAFQELGADLVCSIRNGESRILSGPEKSVDRHLAVFRKPNGGVRTQRTTDSLGA